MYGRSMFLVTCGSLLASLAILAPSRVEAHVTQRNVKVRFESFSGLAAIHNDLKVWDNGDAELVTGSGPKKVLRLSGAEYTSLTTLFTRYDFASMPTSFPGHMVPDGPTYSVTWSATPHGGRHTVSSHMGADEPRGFTVIKNRLYNLVARVQAHGHTVGGSATVVDDSMDGRTISAHVGDTIEVRLAGNPTTGYSWKTVRSSRSLPVASATYEPTSHDPHLMGGGGTFIFTIKPDRFSAGGTHHFKFACFRPWEGESHATKTFTLTVKVAAAEDGGSGSTSGGPGIIDGLGGSH